MGITFSMPNCVAYNTIAVQQVPLASELVLDRLVFSKLAGGAGGGSCGGGPVVWGQAAGPPSPAAGSYKVAPEPSLQRRTKLEAWDCL